MRTAGRGEGLTLVRLYQGLVFDIMTVRAQCRSSFGQMEVEFLLACGAGFMSHVAGIAAHVQSSMVTSHIRNIQALAMAVQTEIGTFNS